jgi:hypothetical protein
MKEFRERAEKDYLYIGHYELYYWGLSIVADTYWTDSVSTNHCDRC